MEGMVEGRTSSCRMGVAECQTCLLKALGYGDGVSTPMWKVQTMADCTRADGPKEEAFEAADGSEPEPTWLDLVCPN